MVLKEVSVLPKIFKKYVKDAMTLRKMTRTEEDEWGNPSYSSVDYAIHGIALPIDFEDLSFLPPGIIKEGDMEFVFLPSYTIGSATVTADTMDRIVYGTKEFEIRIINDIIDGTRVLLRAAFAKRLE